MTRRSTAQRDIPLDGIAEKLREFRGNIAAVARHFGCERGTIRRRIDGSATLQRLLSDEREGMLDNAETTLYKRALDGDIAALIFFLKTQGKNRGYTERVEHTGADGNEVTLRVVYDDKRPDDHVT